LGLLKLEEGESVIENRRVSYKEKRRSVPKLGAGLKGRTKSKRVL